ncbi:MAG: glycosyltransferase family 2 protein [Bacteroidota bacterium]
MIQLSVVIITYNEERNIARCLDSLKGIADEIIVVDSYSTDKTIEICNSYGAKVFQHKFEGYIQQKNYALETTSFNYVLSLDADEVLSDELRTSIAAVKSDWKYDGYEMNRLTNYCSAWIRHGGWYPDRKIRLFDKRKGKWTGVNPHDRYALNESHALVGYLRGDILHYSYYSISEHIKQVDYFTEISARVLFEQKRKASLPRLLGFPVFRFIRDYIFKCGFLDGYYGFVVCVISSHAVFLKYAKLRELWKQ